MNTELVEGWLALLEKGGDDRYPAEELAAWIYAASMLLASTDPELADRCYAAQSAYAFS
jgi:hypothetical protein